MCSVHQAWRRMIPLKGAFKQCNLSYQGSAKMSDPTLPESEGRARKMKKEIIINIWAQFLRDDIWPLKGRYPEILRFAKRKPFPKNAGGKKAIRENKNMCNFHSHGWWIVLFHPFPRAYLSFWPGRHKLETLSVTCHLARWWTATFCRMGNQQLHSNSPQIQALYTPPKAWGCRNCSLGGEHEPWSLNFSKAGATQPKKVPQTLAKCQLRSTYNKSFMRFNSPTKDLHITIPKTNIAPENRPSQKESSLFQPSIFMSQLLVLWSVMHVFLC